jgi:hypothetical protein
MYPQGIWITEKYFIRNKFIYYFVSSNSNSGKFNKDFYRLPL